jgi:hypothetical protein
MRLRALLSGLPRPDLRKSWRYLVDQPGSINDNQQERAVVVTELSTTGARLLTPLPLAVGASVLLQLPLLEPVEARVVWVSNRIAGCEFAEPIPPAQLRIVVAGAESGLPHEPVSVLGERRG